MVEIGVLGPLRLLVEGHEVDVVGRRERCVLANLAVGGRSLSTDRLADALWGDTPPRTAVKALQTAVSNLRRTVREAGGPQNWLVTTPQGYGLDPGLVTTDLALFTAACDRARNDEDPATAVAAFLAARDQWHGDEPAWLGDGVAATIERERIAELGVDARLDALSALVAAGRHEEAVADLAAFTERWPLRERGHELLMLALYRSGRQADALAVHRQLRAALIEEGLDPGPEVDRLAERILAHDPALSRPAAPTTARSAAPPSREPRRGSRLVGRDDAVAATIEALDDGPLVTIVGPGGVGKTSLARQVVRDSRTTTVWCELAAVADADDVLVTLSTSLGLPQQLGVTLDDAVRERLRAAPTLLVLDNCEHLAHAVAALTDGLLASCPDLTVLATSRQPLALADERVLPLDPLSLEAADGEPSDAVQLFLQRARQADPRFRPDDDLTGARLLCERLDGLPLALELAAARVRALTVPQILDHLDAGDDVLGVAGSRRRDLRSMVAWSYDLLGPRQQRLFRRLSILAGSFVMDAAVPIGAGDELPPHEVPGLLADLVDKSMVTVVRATPGHRRYQLLETLRAFGREQLTAAGELAEVERVALAFQVRHVEDVVARCQGPDEARAAVELSASLDNIRQAVDIATRHGEVSARGRLVGRVGWALLYRQRWEAAVWAEEALVALEGLHDVDPEVLGEVAAVVSWSRWYAGDLHGSVAVAERVLEQLAPDEPSRRQVLYARNTAHMYLQVPVPDDQIEVILRLSAAVGDTYLPAVMIAGMALIRGYAGDLAAADRLLARARTFVRTNGSLSARGLWRYACAEVSGDRDPDTTIRLAEESAADAVASGAHVHETIARITAVTVAARHRDVAETLPAFADLLDHCRRLGAWTHVMVLVWNLIEALDRVPATPELQRRMLVLLHAAPDGTPSVYGDQLERLDRIRRDLVSVLPDDEVRRAIAEGVALSRNAMVEAARVAIDLAAG